MIARAGVTRQQFDSEFADLETCLTEAFVSGAARYNRAVFAAYEGEGSWRDRLRSAAYASTRFIRDNNRFIAFSAVALTASTDRARAERDRILRQQIAMIDDGRQELDDPDSMSVGVAEGIVGSIFSELAKGFADGRAKNPEEVVPELMYIAVRPYLGDEAAQEELSTPPPPEP